MRYLLRIKGRWYFNMRVPKDLVPVLNLTVLKKALSCTDLKNARALVTVFSFKAERLFLMVRCGLVKDAEIDQLIEEFKHDRLRELDEERLQREPVVIPETSQEDGEDYSSEYYKYDLEKELLTKLSATNRLSGVRGAVNELLEKKGIAIDEDATWYKRLCREMIRVLITIADVEQQRCQGNYDNEYDKALKEQHTRPALSQVAAPEGVSSSTEEDRKDILLSEAVEEYIREKRATEGDKANEGSLDDFRSINRRFREWVGDVPVRSVRRKHLISFREILHELPKNMKVIKEYREIPIKEVLAVLKGRDDVPRLSPNTQTKYMTRVHTLLDWCVKNDYADRNWADGLAKKPDTEEENRPPYSTEDLQRLIESPVYHSPQPLSEAHQFWIPMIALFTGMRMNEICQLHLQDIVFIEGYHCIDINKKTPDKKLKNKASRRIIPIHPALIKMGFLEYVRHIRERGVTDEQGYERLWPGLIYEQRNYKHKFSKWYAGYCDDHITADKEKNFHSFRHTFISNLQMKSLAEAPVAGFVGHTHKGITFKKYGVGYTPQPLVDVLMRLDYGDAVNKLLEGIKWPAPPTT